MTLRIRHLDTAALRDNTAAKRFARPTHLELHVNLPVGNAQRHSRPQPSRLTRSVLRQADMFVGVLTSQLDCIAKSFAQE